MHRCGTCHNRLRLWYMGKRTSIYLSDYDLQRLAQCGLPLIDVVRQGFAHMELQADLTKVTIKPKPPAPPPPDIVHEAIIQNREWSPPKRQRRNPACTHPPSRVHKGLCGACGQGGL